MRRLTGMEWLGVVMPCITARTNELLLARHTCSVQGLVQRDKAHEYKDHMYWKLQYAVELLLYMVN